MGEAVTCPAWPWVPGAVEGLAPWLCLQLGTETAAWLSGLSLENLNQAWFSSSSRFGLNLEVYTPDLKSLKGNLNASMGHCAQPAVKTHGFKVRFSWLFVSHICLNVRDSPSQSSTISTLSVWAFQFLGEQYRNVHCTNSPSNV